MRTITVSTLGLAAALFVAGCDPSLCQTGKGCAPAAPIVQSYNPEPPLLCQPLKSESRKRQPAGCAVGCATGNEKDLVYDLGCDTVANSTAVTMAGGRAKPVARYRAGGVAANCIPVEEARKAAERLNKNLPPVRVSTAAPAAVPEQVAVSAQATGTSGKDLEVVLTGHAASLYNACPVLPESAAVCQPGDGLSACFTLTEEELREGPPIYQPDEVNKYNATVFGRWEPSKPVDNPSLANEAKALQPPVDLTREPEGASSAGATPAVVEEPEVPADTPAIPSAPGAESEPELGSEPGPQSGSGLNLPVPDAAVAPLAPPPEILDPMPAEGLSGQAVPAAPAVVSESLPPVPQVSDIAQGVEEILKNEATPSPLPAVELPPKLN